MQWGRDTHHCHLHELVVPAPFSFRCPKCPLWVVPAPNIVLLNVRFFKIPFYLSR